MNPTELAILNRYSCRDFKDIRLSKEETDALLAAAMAAPTARNLQELRFNWIDDQELIQEISDLCFKQLDPEFLGRMQERLRGDAAGVQAGAAELAALDEANGEAQVGRAKRGRVAGAAAAEDENVEFCRGCRIGHVVLLASGWRSTRGRGQRGCWRLVL